MATLASMLSRPCAILSGNDNAHDVMSLIAAEIVQEAAARAPDGERAGILHAGRSRSHNGT